MTVKKSVLLYTDHILECITKIEEFTNGYTKVQFINDSKTYDAVIRNLQIMAESTQKLPKELKEHYTEIPWKKISGLRNVLVHDYLEGINYEQVWDTIQNRLPGLKSAMTQMKYDITTNAPVEFL